MGMRRKRGCDDNVSFVPKSLKLSCEMLMIKKSGLRARNNKGSACILQAKPATYLCRKASIVFPVEPPRRSPAVRRPVERDVVQHVVLRRGFAGLSPNDQLPKPGWTRIHAARNTGESVTP